MTGRTYGGGCMKAALRWGTVLLLALAVGVGGGCKKKGPGPGEAGAGGLGEEGIAGGSSLERAKRGQGPEEDGLLKDVHFGYDSYELDSAARAVLSRNVDWLRQNPRAKVE